MGLNKSPYIFRRHGLALIADHMLNVRLTFNFNAVHKMLGHLITLLLFFEASDVMIRVFKIQVGMREHKLVEQFQLLAVLERLNIINNTGFKLHAIFGRNWLLVNQES